MNSDPEPIEEVFSEEERLKREDLDRRLNEMLYSNPPIKPDLAFVTEMIETMMTYSNCTPPPDEQSIQMIKYRVDQENEHIDQNK
uniref:Uncharacterized protein n=1 Tax=Amphimedon queenslandica TaxID=400682 RepID=A0A1X7UGB9_AMPQE